MGEPQHRRSASGGRPSDLVHRVASRTHKSDRCPSVVEIVSFTSKGSGSASCKIVCVAPASDDTATRSGEGGGRDSLHSKIGRRVEINILDRVSNCNRHLGGRRYLPEAGAVSVVFARVVVVVVVMVVRGEPTQRRRSQQEPGNQKQRREAEGQQKTTVYKQYHAARKTQEEIKGCRRETSRRTARSRQAAGGRLLRVGCGCLGGVKWEGNDVEAEWGRERDLARGCGLQSPRLVCSGRLSGSPSPRAKTKNGRQDKPSRSGS
jgi:hypothetical protein